MSGNSSSLVIDVGTSGLRAAIVRPDTRIESLHYVAFSPDSPFPGLVEFDATEMARLVLETATAALAEGGPVGAVGIATQRASTIVWERSTGRPIGPALGWQDLRTVGDCLTITAEHGFPWPLIKRPPKLPGFYRRMSVTDRPLNDELTISVSARSTLGLFGLCLKGPCIAPTTPMPGSLDYAT